MKRICSKNKDTVIESSARKDGRDIRNSTTINEWLMCISIIEKIMMRQVSAFVSYSINLIKRGKEGRRARVKQ